MINESRSKNRIAHLLADLSKNESLTTSQFNAINEGFSFVLPTEYLETMRMFNGGEGEVGRDSWLLLFSFEELKKTNDNYNFLMEEIPDYFLIGKDAADTRYAFHKIDKTFHSFGLISNFKTDSIEFLGNDFVVFLEYLYSYRYQE